MREIKFRQYIQEVTVVGTTIEAHWNYWGYIDGRWHVPLADRDSQQYTGLKDRHGKEIYESDVVRWGVYIGEVYYEEGLWLFDRAEPKGLVPPYKTCEIIGNIYENGELIA